MLLKNLKTILFVTICVITSSCSESGHESLIPDPLEINDYSKRNYTVITPPNYNSNNPTSVIFAFHGSNQSVQHLRSISNFDAIAGAENFIMVYPSSYNGIWAEGCGCTETESLGVDDIGFVDYIMKRIKENFNINENRIFAVGISQGGLFLHNLACRRADRFAGFTSVISSMSTPVSQSCTPITSVNMLLINGTDDNQFLWNGFVHPSNGLQSIPATFDYWAQNAICEDSTTTEVLQDNGVPNFSVEKITKVICSSNKKIILYKVGKGTHTWYSNAEFDTATEVVKFFKSIN